MAKDVNIRSFELKDREAVRFIARSTALAGESATIFLEGDEIISDALTLYFTDYEPESCFVAEQGGRVVGYIFSAKNSIKMDGIISTKIVSYILCRAISSGFIIRKRNFVFLSRCLVSFLKGEFYAPDFSKDYPATLHINLLPEARRIGAGSALMQVMLTYLASNNVSGVRMGTVSPSAKQFFEKHGFSLLFEGRRSYLNHVIHKDLPVYIVGKRFV